MSVDSLLQKAVLAELSWEPSVTSAHIGVTADAGVITLTGDVPSWAEKHAVETACLRVKGVKAIAGELKVKLSVETKRSDAELAAAAVERLFWDVSVPRYSVKVTVEDGWLTLTGDVDWHFQREAAEQDIQRLFGVTGASNQITVKPRVDAFNLSDTIMHALHRSWFFDPQAIKIDADGGKIRLSGTVNSPHDRDLAMAAAWAAPGATAVQNDIAIV